MKMVWRNVPKPPEGFHWAFANERTEYDDHGIPTFIAEVVLKPNAISST